jgi:hypothetical protein
LEKHETPARHQINAGIVSSRFYTLREGLAQLNGEENIWGMNQELTKPATKR